MTGPHLIPELQALLDVVAAKEAERQARLMISSTQLNDRGAAFVWIPEDTQRAVVNLVRETTSLPLDFAIKDLQRQLDEKDAAIERLRKEPEELRNLLNKRDNQLSDLSLENATLRLANAEQERKLVQCLKEKNVLREDAEAKLSKARKEERANTQEATAPWTIDQRYEALLQSAELYKEAVCECKTNLINRQSVTKQLAKIRHKLTILENAISGIETP